MQYTYQDPKSIYFSNPIKFKISHVYKPMTDR